MSQSSSPAPSTPTILPRPPSRPPSAPSTGNSTMIVVSSANGGTNRYRVLAAPSPGGATNAISNPLHTAGRTNPQKLTAIIAPSTKQPPSFPTPVLRGLQTAATGNSPAFAPQSTSAISSATPSPQQAGRPVVVQQQQPADDQSKCARFFKTLIQLSEKQNQQSAAVVRQLIKVCY